MLCRIWQFVFGTFVYYRTRNAKLEANDNVSLQPLPCADDRKPKIVILYSKLWYSILTAILVALLLNTIKLAFFPYSSVILRIISTVLAAAMIEYGAFVRFSSPVASVLVYIGDASYSIYLCHWPIIIFFRYLGISNQLG